MSAGSLCFAGAWQLRSVAGPDVVSVAQMAYCAALWKKAGVNCQAYSVPCLIHAACVHKTCFTPAATAIYSLAP